MEFSEEIMKRHKAVQEWNMPIGITGTQDGLSEAQFKVAKDLFELMFMSEIHAGDCVGVDAELITLVQEIRPEVKTVGHIPDKDDKRAFLEYDEERDPKPYLKRNHDIVNESEYLFAFPNGPERMRGSGTWATIRYARKTGKGIVIINPDGTSTA